MSARRQTGDIVKLAGVGAALFTYASAIEPQLVEHVQFTLNCPRLPAEFDGYRVLLLSDFHSRKFGMREQNVLKTIQNLPPHDIIALCGDLVHTPEGTEGMAKFIGQLHANDGVFVTFGNSEHKNGVVPHTLAKAFSAVGAKMLINKNTTINRGDSCIAIAGVDDNVSGHDKIQDALKSIPDNQFKLLLMHSPDSIGKAAAFGVDLVLSGHTHGGQVKFPFIGSPYTHSHFGSRMSHGLYRKKKLSSLIGFHAGITQLYVTRGVGTSGLALRFLCRPEITTITLRRGPLL